ncbi:MAG: hypothetical protein K2O67_04305, partial [Clostridia bacterium]|nr:hypothetical protein [Clostridia bacterium]
MKRNAKNKFIMCIIAIAIALLAALCAIFSHTTAAQAYETLPTGKNAIGNIYKDNGKFSKDNLDALAKKAGYTGVDEMVTAAEGGEIKTSEDFGETVVNFGSYTFKGTAYELTWIPAYLSNSDDGPILTLWLAQTVSSNGTNSNQEVSTWSDGTYGTSSKSWNGSTVYSNTYDSSYIRNYVLNGSTDYTKKWGSGTAITPPAASTMTKFTQFIGEGALASYIVKPNAVGWQTAENRTKNDAAWNYKGLGANYPSAWLNDNLWIPSFYEVVDINIAANSAQGSFSENGGLWHTGDNSTSGRQKRSNMYRATMVRTAYSTNYNFTYYLTTSGAPQTTGLAACGQIELAVRPALHLNLSEAAINSEYSHVHSMTKISAKAPDCTTAGNVGYWHCTGCDKYFSDADGATEIELADTVVEATGHQFAEGWSSNETHHWHASTCGHDEKDGMAVHSWNDGVPTKEASCYAEGIKTFTCTVCAKTKTEAIPKTEHTPETVAAVAPGCTTTGLTAGSNCSVCGETLTAQQTVSATGHSWNNGEITKTPTCTAEGAKTFTCSSCGETKTETVEKIAHTPEEVAAVAPGCTTTGLSVGSKCSVCSTVLTAQKVLAAVGHNYVAVAGGEPPTCTTPGYGEVRCTRCGNEHAGDSIPATGHTPGDEATCTEPQICTVCNTELVAALGHSFGAWEVTKPATFTEEGSQRRECTRCDIFEEEVIPAKGVTTNEITLTLNSNYAYGDEISPVISAKQGEVVLKWYNTVTGEELSAKPSTVGSYKLVAKVEENLEDGYTGAEKEVEFTISKREITVTINAGSSEQGSDLEELSAIVTSGTVVGDIPYTLSTNADKEAMGTYAITGVCTNDNYEITFVDGVYIVSKKAEDPSGNGEIDLPVDINVEFKVTQSQTSSDYSDLKGLKTGYWAQLWYRNEDGTLGDEFTDKMNCILTLKIPTDIIEAIRGGEEINREKIAEGLNIYYVDGDGDYNKVKAFTIAQKEDESWIVKFNYNEKFRAEVVFSAPNVEEPAEEPETSGIPWWVWLLVGLGGATLLAMIIVIIVIAKKKNNGNNGGSQYDDAELKAQLAEQGEKIDELLGRDDGGFNTPV